MDVPAEHDRDIAWQVARTDHVGTATKGEIPRTAGRSLDAVVEAQHARIGRRGLAARLGKHFRKPPADVVRVGKAREGDSQAPRLEHHGARPIEHVQALVRGQQRVGDARPLVVARHQEDGHSARRHALERLQRRQDEPGRHAAAVQQVAAVHHHVGLAGEGRRQRQLVVAEEVVAPPPPLHARAAWEVQPQVRVG